MLIPDMAGRAPLYQPQGGLLVSRTLLTDYISRIEGTCGRSLVSQRFDKFGRAVLAFAAVGIPAAVVNAGLKYMQKRIELSFQQRLSLYLHKQYTSNRSYYAASTLGGGLVAACPSTAGACKQEFCDRMRRSHIRPCHSSHLKMPPSARPQKSLSKQHLGLGWMNTLEMMVVSISELQINEGRFAFLNVYMKFFC